MNYQKFQMNFIKWSLNLQYRLRRKLMENCFCFSVQLSLYQTQLISYHLALSKNTIVLKATP